MQITFPYNIIFKSKTYITWQLIIIPTLMATLTCKAAKFYILVVKSSYLNPIWWFFDETYDDSINPFCLKKMTKKRKLKDTINSLQLFVFTVVLDGSLWVGYFIYLKFARVSPIVYQSLSSIKERNWLINKGMCVLLFDAFKHLLLRKTDVLKTCQKTKFLEKKIWRNAQALKSKKVQSIFGKTFILALLSSVVFSLHFF